MTSEISEKEQLHIVEMRKAGNSVWFISDITGYAKSTIEKILGKYGLTTNEFRITPYNEQIERWRKSFAW